ncbi:hypothetical protein MTYP_00062 [Methylophilaceae bacterium]|nr:hypothetical protein MTYP_00062 [Methylophilaceae bacterium]
MFDRLRKFWCAIRHLSGDDAYERYLKHYAEFHESTVDAPPPLTRKEFFKYWQENKWKGTNRCC